MAFGTSPECRSDGVHLEGRVGEFEKDWILMDFGWFLIGFYWWLFVDLVEFERVCVFSFWIGWRKMKNVIFVLLLRLCSCQFSPLAQKWYLDLKPKTSITESHLFTIKPNVSLLINKSTTHAFISKGKLCQVLNHKKLLHYSQLNRKKLSYNPIDN